MPGNREIQQRAQTVHVLLRIEILKRTNANMALRNTDKDSARFQCFAVNVLPCRDHSQCAGGGNAKREHRFT